MNMDNYMVAVIYGDNDEKRKDKFGKIDMIGNINSNLLHSATILEYGRKYFPDIDAFQKLNVKHTPPTISYYFVELGHVVFCNTTSKDINGKSVKTGIFYFPDNISEKLKQIIYKFVNQISDYRIIIVDDLKIVDGLLYWQSFQETMETPTPKDLLDLYFDKQKNRIRKR